MNKNKYKKALTLTELILIVLLLGILAAVVLPRLGGRDFLLEMRLNTAARQIASDTRYARRLAITNAQNYTIVFYKNETYDILQGDFASGTSIGRDFPKQLPPGVTFYEPFQTWLPYYRLVVFDKLGAPVYPVAPILLRANSHGRTVRVHAITGSVTIE